MIVTSIENSTRCC